MRISPAYPIRNFDDLDSPFGAVLVRSFSVTGGDAKTAFRSLSFNDRIAQPNGSGKVIIERSLSFEGKKLESKFSFKTPTGDMENQVFGRVMSVKDKDDGDQSPRSNDFHESRSNDFHNNKSNPALSVMGNQRYQAALKLQKVYKSFRTRRRLADCAVLAEQRWWKVLDFAELKRSSISFFDIEKQETALSRWSRARTRAAKVGKGLSKDEKARKLALQHWLEAIDPRHRYGHNLQFYYVTWLHCESEQPFFYWLDIGEGREVNLERCPRSKLQQQCIKYLGPTERTEYEVVMEDGKLIYKKSGQLLDTTGGPKDAKWIFVLSTSKTLYVGQKKKGTFQHSSFLAGGATLSAGRLVVEEGILKAIWPHSGHYLPTEENFNAFMSFLNEHNVDLTNVQKAPQEEDEGAATIQSYSLHINTSEAEVFEDTEVTDAKKSAQEDIASIEESNAAEKSAEQKSRLSRRFGSKVTRLEVPPRGDEIYIFKTDVLPRSCHLQSAESPSEDGYETAEESFLSEEEFMVPKKNLFDEDDAEENEKHIPKEKIMRRIDSHKGMNSYQLAQQLSARWSTGAGPRIGCMRDYPSELQFRVLEQANLSPRARSASPIRFQLSPKVTTPPTLLGKKARAVRSTLAPEQRELSRTATQ